MGSQAAPLVQTPIQLAVHSRTEDVSGLCSTRASNTRMSHVALGDVVRIRASGMAKRKGLVASVEQGVAIVLMDVQTQTPVHTYTLAPSDRACTPPLVVERREGEALRRTTYLGLEHGEDTTVWALTEALDARGHRVPGTDTEKETMDVAGRVQGLFVLRTGELLAVRDEAVVLVGAQEECACAGVRYDTQMLDEPAAARIVPEEGVMGALTVVGAHDTLQLAVVAVHASAPRLRVHTSPVLPHVSVEKVASAVWEPQGTLAVLLRSGELVSAHASLASGGIEVAEARSVTLAPLREGDKTTSEILFLSPSHLLLLALPPGDKGKERATALIWDIDLDTVLAQVEWSLSATPSRGVPSVCATHATDAHVLVLIDAPHRDVVRSSVLALPVSVPDTGLLVHALHTAAQTAPWIGEEAHSAQALGATYDAFVARIAALGDEERVAQLDTLFPQLIADESERLRVAENVKASRKAPKPVLPTPFVQRVLDWALPAAKKGDAAVYAPNTLRYLLERGVVSAAMVPSDALVARVRATHDWTTLYLVLRHVPDLAEKDAMAIVKDALLATSDAGAPTVARVLQHVLAPPPFSKPAMRMALRTHIVDNKHVLILLDIVRCWLHSQLQAPLDAHRETRQADSLRTVPRTSIRYRTSDVRAPQLDAVVSFGEDLLDTYFPQLLADPTTHLCLAECTRALTHDANTLQTLTRLSAPLDAFALAEKSKGTAKAETKSKRLALHEASLLVPLYSRETLDV